MRDKDLFTVVVADDEEELRDAVCRLIPWQKIGFRLVGSAGNGLDALQLVEQFQPDLLLTDIQMPFITGTELARQVRELQPMIQIAFLSGYDDFTYAKLGIEYEIISYLLKPISMEELTNALRSIHNKMVVKFQTLAAAPERGGDLPLTVASLLLDSFACPAQEEATLAALSEQGFPVTAASQLTVLSTTVTAAELPAAVAIIDRVLQQNYHCCSIPSGRRVLTLLASEDGLFHLGVALDELMQVLRRLLDENCVIGVSRPFQSISRCHAACREAVELQSAPGEGGIRRASDLLQGGMNELCGRAMRIIEQYYRDPELSLASVSEQLHVSPNYLSANMKKYAGDTFINLLIKKRMEAALALITSGNIRIAEVASRCGYADQHYFGFCFKKYYGVSPAKMRRESREGGHET